MYNDYLRGISGGRQVEVNARGRVINIVADELPKKGKDIYLTIDSQLQAIAFDVMKKYRGSFIVMNVNTGAIVTMVTTPSFDVNKFRKSSSYLNSVFNNKERPTLNRPIQAAYPIGSVFKPVVAIAALETKKINDKSKFLCTGNFSLGRSRFKCNSQHDWQDVGDAIAHSCNVFFYNTGMRLGSDYLTDYGHMVGLGRKTNIDLPNEKEGIIPSKVWKRKRLKQKWYSGDTINMSIGQGYVNATPIQVAMLMSFFATGGVLVQPHVVETIEETTFKDYAVERYEIDRRMMYLVKDGLRRVVVDKKGTARDLRKLDMQIAGKTGTAQVSKKKAHGWFAGFFPYRDPQYSVVVMLENAGSSHVAVDVLSEIFTKAKENNIFPEFINESVGVTMNKRIIFISLVLFLNILNLTMLYSAVHGPEGAFFVSVFMKQIVWIAVGWILAFLVSNINYRLYYDASLFLYFLSLIFLLLVVVLGHMQMGAQRWINILGITFQPAELAKIAVLFITARTFTTINTRVGYRKRGFIEEIIVPFLPVSVIFILIFIQPDLGTALVIVFMYAIVLLANSPNVINILAASGIALAGVPLGWALLKPYQKGRVLTFLNPERDPLGAGYTIIQSKIAIGSGKILGKGFMSGTQNQFNFIPARHTDFIFSVFAEEWGFVGCVLLLIVFYFLMKLILDSAAKATEVFASNMCIEYSHYFLYICL